MSFLPLGKPKRKRGRPEGSVIHNREITKSAIRITPSLWEIIIAERIEGEYYSETLLRILRDKSKKVDFYRKRVEQLEEEKKAFIDWKNSAMQQHPTLQYKK